MPPCPGFAPSPFCRYWYILNGQGRSQEVKGPGVVGEQPELAPGQSFSYQSGGLVAGWQVAGWVASRPLQLRDHGGEACVCMMAAPHPPPPRTPPVPAACPLPTPKGSMEGHFEFYARDADSGQWRKSFLVKIGQFALRAD